MVMSNDKTGTASEALKKITTQDFLRFGVQQVAYVRPVRVEDRVAWAIHAADGTPLTVTDDREVAIALVRHNELEPVTVQ